MTRRAAGSAPEDVRWCCRCGSAMVTGEHGGKPRRICPACGFVHFVEPRVGVGVAVVEGGRILLVKRRYPPEKGRWAIPAGYLDHGDDPREQAVREVREETGLEVTLDGLVDVFHNPPEQGGASVFVLYRGRVAGGLLAAADDALEAAFFPPDALPELAFESTRHAVRALLGAVPGR